ncbi:MAG: exodeoxyribonuclease V subunit gamma [Rhodoferax sp.]|uniref:exodeoxyribonuclease V subunit gamma n=1 Tax=Rhodoferax sp. TaxID=50421 RepID=UPI0026062579|nr:exodeoxyribonuclease V subunit gamma [Rhodoferax sp.]MDD2881354.1 exodeoxyribonuclease V subunit gamma [Rhodoferax sp.]
MTTSDLPAGFMVLHGNRLEDLRDLLLQVLQAQPLAVLEPEVILLQSNGMKHWLEMALASDDALGVCAATRMALPGAYLWQVYRAVLGPEAVPAAMPFDKNSLVWRLVRLLPDLCERHAVYAPLKRYLGEPLQPRKLYQLALQLADVLDGYQSYRADWLADWAAGRDVLRDAKGAGQGAADVAALPPEHAWQAQLWRDIRADVGADFEDSSRAAVHERFLVAMTAVKRQVDATGQRPPGLPARLVVFGVSSLPMQLVQALAALGQVSQVLMLVQNPCQYFWGDIVEGHAALRAQVRRRQSPKASAEPASAPLALDASRAATHPLLASWGKQGRDYLHLLDGFDAPEQYRQHWTRVDVFVDPTTAAPERPASQLALLQSAMLNLNPEPDAPQPLSDDGSLEFVSAHSAQRELEVLHDRLLAWFEDDATLKPRDVMVMVPDMEAFAPHIQAVFGRFAPGQPGFIPYAVADTTTRSTPLVQALEQLLSLPQARLTLFEWASLFEVAAVRKRFKVSEADVQLLQDWLATAGVRWGLDAAHRQVWGLPTGTQGLAQNTWAFGLRRLLLGYAVGADLGSATGRGDGGGNDDGDVADAGEAPGAGGLWHDTLAQPALSGLSAALMGSLLDWLQSITDTLAALSQDHTPAEWGVTLNQLLQRFFAPADDSEERALARVLEPLQSWLDACDAAGLDTPFPLEVVREHWLSQIEVGGLQQRFFGGGVQFGTLMPMRSIPFAVIGLLGMNDGAYPRAQAARDFDLMASSWRAGDRSRREDDRYLFLEAILSARQKLYVSWQGHSATDNSKRPPSVLVAQLLDHINALWTPSHSAQVQPLQPFSKVYFEAASGFCTFDKDWAVAHINKAQVAIENVVSNPDIVCPTSLTLDDLQRLLRAPVEVFFRNRLQTTLDQLSDLAEPDEPFALNALQQHQAGADLLQSFASSQSLARLQGAGQLPLAAFGQHTSEVLLDVATQVRARRDPWLARYPLALAAQPVDLSFDHGTSLSGALDGLFAQAGTQTASSGSQRDQYGQMPANNPVNPPASACLQLAARPGAVLQGKPGAQQARGHVLVALWVRHLAGCASGLHLTSVVVGVDGQVVLPPMSADAAHTALSKLVQAYTQAWGQPLPVACKTAFAYLQTQAANAQLPPDKPPKDPHEAARLVFDTQPGARFPGEWAQSAYLQRAFASYDDVREGLPHWAQVLYGELAARVDVTQSTAEVLP